MYVASQLLLPIGPTLLYAIADSVLIVNFIIVASINLFVHAYVDQLPRHLVPSWLSSSILCIVIQLK